MLGSGGQLGLPVVTAHGDAAYVNAQTGNLVVQRQDEILMGRGPDVGVVRTYNSQGGFDFDNDDQWQLSLYRQLSGLMGTVNTAGSTITRTGADGVQLVYTYDSTVGSSTFGRYVNRDGSGSVDTLTYTSSNNRWAWVDGDSRITETYFSSGTGVWRIASTVNLDGNDLVYTYDVNGLMTEIRSDASEKTQLIYNTDKQLMQVNVVDTAGNTITRVRYSYDALNRLTAVSTDLTPADGSIADRQAYITQYTYDGTSKRIASIAHGDGTIVSFSYDASGRVLRVTDGAGKVTEFAYAVATTATTSSSTVKDALGQITTLTYNTGGNGIHQLARLQGPAGSGQDLQYLYNANGDVTQSSDGRGGWVKYTYDAEGNQLSQQDSLGNTITRTYTALNALLTETVYATPDANVANSTLAAGAPQTTTYVYSEDGKNRLRFVVSHAGRVTEYRYNSVGQRISAIQYTHDLYPVGGTPTETPSESGLTTWLTPLIKTRSQRTDSIYDLRGQLSRVTTYTEVNTAAGLEGNGLSNGTTLATQYVYDQRGNLLQKIEGRGVATTNVAGDYQTSYAYDGMNRLTSMTDGVGNVTTTVYNDATRQTATTLANGLVTTRTYDAVGRLVSVSEANGATVLGTTSYVYDAVGNLRQETNPLGHKTFHLYDNAGRKVGEIDAERALTEWVYNANGQVIRTLRYQTLLDAAALTGNAALLQLATLRPAVHVEDRVSYTLYDGAGRLAKEIDAVGAVTVYQYDGMSRLVRTTWHANALSGMQRAALAALSSEVSPGDANTVPVVDSANDRFSRQLYDDDGLLAGELDANGYLTEYSYDAAGRQVSQLRYGKASIANYWAAGTLVQLRTGASTADDQRTHALYNAAGQLTGVVDAAGYLTEYTYDQSGNRTQAIRYATAINYVVGNTVAESRPVTTTEDRRLVTGYDANNRVVQTDSRPDNLITTYVYDNVGQLVETVRAVGAAEARANLVRYDLQGRVMAELGGEGVKALEVLKAEVVAASGPGTEPTQVQIDSVWNTYGMRYVYDKAGQRIQTILPNGTSTSGLKTRYYYDHDGRLTHVINALNEVTEYRYNAFDEQAVERRYNIRIVGSFNGGNSTGNTALTDAMAALGNDYSETLMAYDQAGQAVALTDALGNTDTLAYNAFGELASKTVKIDGSSSVTTAMTYDRRGQVKTVTDDAVAGGLNRTVASSYDAFGRVISVTNGMGQVTQYSYDPLGRQVTVTDPNNVITTTTYDAFSRVVTETNGRGHVTSYSYTTSTRKMVMTTAEGVSMETVRNRHGEVVSVKDGRGQTTSYTYNNNGQLTATLLPIGTSTGTAYDTAGRVLTTTDARGIITQYTYDAANRLLTRVDDSGGLNLTTSYRYDAQGRAVWSRDARNIWTRTDYDAKGQVVAVVMDPSQVPVSNGQLVDNANPLNLTTRYSYDARGKTLTVTESADTATARTTQYVYDASGRRVQEVVDPGAGKLNLSTAYVYDKNDHVVLKTDANGNKTVYTYDKNQRLVYTVDALGHVTQHTYDAIGNLTVVRRYASLVSNLADLQANPVGTAVSVVGGNNSTDRFTRYTYDQDNRLTHTVDAAGAVTGLDYDANGNVIKRTQYANRLGSSQMPANGAIPAVVVDAAADRITQMTYDAANRLTYQIDAERYVTRMEYDANGNVVRQTYYANQRASFPSPGATPTISANAVNDRVTQRVYDGANRLVFSVDAERYVTQRTYDGLGNLTLSKRFANRMEGDLTSSSTLQTVTVAPPPGTVPPPVYVVLNGSKDQLTKYFYDKAGRLTDSVDAQGYITRTLYDALGQVIERTVAADTASASVTRYSHDQAGRVLEETRAYGSINPDGTSSASTTRFAYDALGQQVTITEAYGTADARTVHQVFDLTGRKTEAMDALGNRTRTEYNSFGDIVKVIDANGNAGFFYTDLLGRVTLQVDPEGAVTRTSYNAFGEQTEILRHVTKVATASVSTTTVPVVTGTAADQRQTVRYDLLGRQSEIQTWWGAGVTEYYSETFSYDGFGNVLSVNGRNNATTTYGYDKLNRKVSETLPVTVSVKKPDNSIEQRPVINTYAYDAHGNLISKTEADGLPEARTTSYTYDRANRQLTEAVFVGTTYNGLNNTAATNVTATRSRSYDGRHNLVLESDANGNKTYHYYDAQDRKIGLVAADGSYTAWTYDAAGNRLTETRYGNGVGTPVVGTLPTVVADSNIDRTTYYSYDKLGRVTKSEVRNIATGAYGSSGGGQYQMSTGSLATTTVYDALGNVMRVVDANGNTTRSWYNKAGQAVARVDALGYVTVWERDAYGNITRETQYAKPASAATPSLTVTHTTTLEALTSAVSTLADPDDRVTEMAFDRLSRVLSERRLNVVSGSVNASTGVLAAQTGSATTRYVYDGLNNVTKKTVALDATTTAVTDWGYDGLGRRTTQQNPGYTDDEGTLVRPQTDWAYDGLGNITRQVVRGKNNNLTGTTLSGQVESDDRITVYAYGAGGRLLTETDATGATVEYRYDAQGNIKQRTLLGLVNADNQAVNGATTFSYDTLNRQVWSKNLGTAVVSEVRYNRFNEVTGKRSYVGAIPVVSDAANPASGWDEYAAYDQAGRVWKSNTGDGITKVYVYDKAGNATLTVTGTLDMRTMTLAEVINQRALDVQNEVTQQTQYTFSVYDARQQLI
ncbi:RHS repeat protein, partial [Pseudomethylobacillus aquaticus]